MKRRLWLPLAMVVATLLSAWLTATRLHVTSDLSALFPDRTASVALGRFVRTFGGGDVAAVLVRGKEPGDVEKAALELAALLRPRPSVADVMDRALPQAQATDKLDPTMAWRYAGPVARAALEQAL